MKDLIQIYNISIDFRVISIMKSLKIKLSNCFRYNGSNNNAKNDEWNATIRHTNEPHFHNSRGGCSHTVHIIEH